MREIKFKVLNPTTGLLVGYERLKSGPELYYCWQYSTDDIEWHNGVFQDEDWLRVQYTGLKDRNGVDICEGDIVKWGKHCDLCKENRERIAEVKFNPDLQFDDSSTKHIFNYGNFAYAARGDRRELVHLEVIGNVYKSPELLQPNNLQEAA